MSQNHNIQSKGKKMPSKKGLCRLALAPLMRQRMTRMTLPVATYPISFPRRFGYFRSGVGVRLAFLWSGSARSFDTRPTWHGPKWLQKSV